MSGTEDQQCINWVSTILLYENVCGSLTDKIISIVDTPEVFCLRVY